MISKEASLMALTPPEFDGECMICKLWRRLLPWQVMENGTTWGQVRSGCGKTILVQQLRSRLHGSFTKVALFEVILPFGVNRLEAELLISDFEKEELIITMEGRHNENGFCHNTLSPLAPGQSGSAVTVKTSAKRDDAREPSRLLPSLYYVWREPAAVVPLSQPRKRRVWRRLSQAEVFERCRILSRELREAGQG